MKLRIAPVHSNLINYNVVSDRHINVDPKVEASIAR